LGLAQLPVNHIFESSFIFSQLIATHGKLQRLATKLSIRLTHGTVLGLDAGYVNLICGLKKVPHLPNDAVDILAQGYGLFDVTYC
jgi:hypothetical protein